MNPKHLAASGLLLGLMALFLPLDTAFAAPSSTILGAAKGAEPPPTTWTKEWTDKLVSSWEEHIAIIPFAVTVDDRRQLVQCFLKGFIAEAPGGPAQMLQLSQERLWSLTMRSAKSAGLNSSKRS